LKTGVEEIEQLMNKESGLKGISGLSNDMRVLEKSSPSNPRARLAIEIFAYRVKKYIGAYTAVLGGCDALVFTGGIGENQPAVRKKICRGIFGLLRKKPKILVVPTDEELMIARQTYRLALN